MIWFVLAKLSGCVCVCVCLYICPNVYGSFVITLREREREYIKNSCLGNSEKSFVSIRWDSWRENAREVSLLVDVIKSNPIQLG